MKQFYIIFVVTLSLMNSAMSQWVTLSSGTSINLYDVFFTDSNTGYAVGDSGIILKTINAGETWSALSSGTNYDLNSIHFPAPNIGYAVGDGYNGSVHEGIILKTIDGGTTWTATFIAIGNEVFISDVFSPDTITGYTSCSRHIIDMTYNPFIEKTMDGGTTWTYLDFVGPYIFVGSIFFTDINTGYAVGTAGHNAGVGLIAKTSDGGATWTGLSHPSSWGLTSVYFTDNNTGFIVSGKGDIQKTIDAGTNWIALSSGTTSALASVFFPDANTGYAVGHNDTNSVGTIVKTINGGTTWMELSSGTTYHLYAVHFTNTETGYVVGENGTILKTTNGGGFPLRINEKPLDKNSLKFYPTPSSDKITIETSTEGHVYIQNLNGQELLNHHISKPSAQIDINGLPVGIYFIKFINENTALVGKIIKQ